MQFPIPFVPADGFEGGRGWDAPRPLVAAQLKVPGGVLTHGACDLFGAPGTPVLAVADGFVRDHPRMFYPIVKGRPVTLADQVTYTFSIQHHGFIARYCEIDLNIKVAVNDYVLEGQVIAVIGNQPGSMDMLHFELYRGNMFGSLFVDIVLENAPYFRRADIYDPTRFLKDCAHTAVWKEARTYEYIYDDDGRMFLKPPSKPYVHDFSRKYGRPDFQSPTHNSQPE